MKKTILAIVCALSIGEMKAQCATDIYTDLSWEQENAGVWTPAVGGAVSTSWPNQLASIQANIGIPAQGIWGNNTWLSSSNTCHVRKVFNIPSGCCIGTNDSVFIQGDDTSAVYINGTLIGSQFGWSTAKKFAIPPGVLTIGTNTIEIYGFSSISYYWVAARLKIAGCTTIPPCPGKSNIIGEVYNSSDDNLPNTVVESNNAFVITGYTDRGTMGFDQPHFTVRDHSSTIVAQYRLDLGTANRGVYLMDISSINTNNTFFATGMVKNGVTHQAFIAQIDVTTGTVLQSSLFSLSRNAIPYAVHFDNNNGQVLVVGELLENTTDPFVVNPTAWWWDRGVGFVHCVDINNLSNEFWSLEGLHTGGTNNENWGSRFDNIVSTPSGYFVSGMQTKIFHNPFGIQPHTKRCEYFMVDPTGTILWQNSFYPSDASIGASAYYSSTYSQIILLYQSTIIHSYGLTAIDELTGSRVAHSEFQTCPFTTNGGITPVPCSEIYACKITKDYSTAGESLIIGGFLNPGQVGSMSSFSYHPFYTTVMYDGVNFTSTSPISYFQRAQTMVFGSSYFENTGNWMPNSFDMITDNNNPKNRIYLVSKEDTPNNILLNSSKVCLLDKTCLDFVRTYDRSISWIDSPFIDISGIFLGTTALGSTTNLRSNNQSLHCGDFVTAKRTSSLENAVLSNNSVFENDEPVVVYTIVGQKIYTGTYGSFIQSKANLSAEIAQSMLLVRSLKSNKTIKVVLEIGR